MDLWMGNSIETLSFNDLALSTRTSFARTVSVMHLQRRLLHLHAFSSSSNDRQTDRQRTQHDAKNCASRAHSIEERKEKKAAGTKHFTRNVALGA